jgi:hypothetical protein
LLMGLSSIACLMGEQSGGCCECCECCELHEAGLSRGRLSASIVVGSGERRRMEWDSRAPALELGGWTKGGLALLEEVAFPGRRS